MNITIELPDLEEYHSSIIFKVYRILNKTIEDLYYALPEGIYPTTQVDDKSPVTWNEENFKNFLSKGLDNQ